MRAGVGTQRCHRRHGALCDARSGAAPARVCRAQHPRLGVFQQQRVAVGAADGQQHPVLGAHLGVGGLLACPCPYHLCAVDLIQPRHLLRPEAQTARQCRAVAGHQGGVVLAVIQVQPGVGPPTDPPGT